MRMIATLALTAFAALPAPGQSPALVDQLKQLAFYDRNQPAAVSALESARPNADPMNPNWLAAVSWAARGALLAKDYEQAARYAEEAYDGSVAIADRAGVDSSGTLATALGAAIEVMGKGMAETGDTAGASHFLTAERERWSGTSIETRIQKNLLLVSLEGKPMPDLEHDVMLTGSESDLAIDGEVGLFFFWAHWCSDCKRQRPIIEELHAKYAGRGLRLIGPTRVYGYIGARQNVPADEEQAYIAGEWAEQYGIPEWMPTPLSAANFVNFGVSTTPTLVLVDRDGIVQMYHPGQMTLAELEAKILPLLAD